MVEVMTWSPGRASPKIARLSASVPPLVKTISDARQPSKRRNRFARALDRRPRLLPMMMDGRGVAEVLAEVRPHGLENLGQNRRGGVVVEINPAHHTPSIVLMFTRMDGPGWMDRSGNWMITHSAKDAARRVLREVSRQSS